VEFPDLKCHRRAVNWSGRITVYVNTFTV